MTTMVHDRETETRYVRVAAPRTSGRRPIGPKAQAAVPTDIFEDVEKEAERREVPMSTVWREMILDAHARRTWGDR